MTSQRYTVDPEWQTTLHVRVGVRRLVMASDSRCGPRFDADALAAALNLGARSLPAGVARTIKGNYGLTGDGLNFLSKQRKGGPK